PHLAPHRGPQPYRNGERDLSRAERRPAGPTQPTPAGAGQVFRLVREVQRAAVVLLSELGARLLEQRARLRDICARGRLRAGPGGGAVFGHLRRHGRRLEQTRRERRHYSGIEERATKVAHPAASCESACSCCIGSWAWALTHTPGCGIVTTKPSLTRSGCA